MQGYFRRGTATCVMWLGRNKQTALPKYDSPLTMASVINNFFIDKIDNIRAEFLLLEANLSSYSFPSMDSIMPMCLISLFHFDPVTDTTFNKYFLYE